MTKDEALKLALEALIWARAFIEGDAPVEVWSVNDKAITAIKEALENPETDWERVARIKEEMLRVSFEDNKRLKEALANEALEKKAENARELGLDYEPEHGWTPERIAGMARLKEAQDKKLAQLEQPKVRTGNCLRVGVCASEGHKIAPQRTWVGLTDIDYEGLPLEQVGFVRWAEAKLKEKNT